MVRCIDMTNKSDDNACAQMFEQAICLSSSMLTPGAALAGVSMALVRVYIASTKPECADKATFLRVMDQVYDMTRSMLEEVGKIPKTEGALQ
jgi:hypothetical protein